MITTQTITFINNSEILHTQMKPVMEEHQRK